MKPDGMRNWIGALVILAVLAMGVAAILAVSGCGNMSREQAREAMKRCLDAGGVPTGGISQGLDGKYGVLCRMDPPR